MGSIHSCGAVGHIEDIVVAKDQQGKKLGLHIIQTLDYLGQKIGCYKVRRNGFLPVSYIAIIMPVVFICVTPLTSNLFETDHSRLFRSQRRLLRQMRVQARRPGNGALLLDNVVERLEGQMSRCYSNRLFIAPGL